jgi:hypothetical protein
MGWGAHEVLLRVVMGGSGRQWVSASQARRSSQDGPVMGNGIEETMVRRVGCDALTLRSIDRYEYLIRIIKSIAIID